MLAKEIGIKFIVLLLEGTETFSVAPCDDLDGIIEMILLETTRQVRAKRYHRPLTWGISQPQPQPQPSQPKPKC